MRPAYSMFFAAYVPMFKFVIVTDSVPPLVHMIYIQTIVMNLS